jgi:hypothetical protein
MNLWDDGVWYLDDGVWYLDDGVWYLWDDGVWYLDDGVWYLDDGVWYLDDGVWYLDDGVWYLDMQLTYTAYLCCRAVELGCTAACAAQMHCVRTQPCAMGAAACKQPCALGAAAYMHSSACTGFSVSFQKGQKLRKACGSPSYAAPEIVARRPYSPVCVCVCVCSMPPPEPPELVARRPVQVTACARSGARLRVRGEETFEDSETGVP